MAGSREATIMVPTEPRETGGSRPGGSTDRPSPSFWRPGASAIGQDAISEGSYVTLKVFPELRLRNGHPWYAGGLVIVNDEHGIILAKNDGKFRPSYSIPARYFEKGLVRLGDLEI